MRASSRAARDRAFVLRVSPYGESDAIASLLTEAHGVVAAIARRARASTPRRTLLLEPFHTLAIEIARGTGELDHLRTAAIDVARPSLLDHAAAMDAAGRAARWTRVLCPPREPEPRVFAAMDALLDALAAAPTRIDAPLSAFGLTLLESLGYALELARCAKCGRERPLGKAAHLRGREGGVVCSACRDARLDEDAFPGALLDAVAEDPANARAADDAIAPRLLAVVADAIDARARAVGSRRGAR